jgi:hypothetical protein
LTTKSHDYRENARNCAELAADAKNEPARNRYKHMEAAWLALAESKIGSMGMLHPKLRN